VCLISPERGGLACEKRGTGVGIRPLLGKKRGKRKGYLPVQVKRGEKGKRAMTPSNRCWGKREERTLILYAE